MPEEEETSAVRKLQIGDLYHGFVVTHLETEIKQVPGNRIRERLLITCSNGMILMDDVISDELAYADIHGDKFKDGKLLDIQFPKSPSSSKKKKNNDDGPSKRSNSSWNWKKQRAGQRNKTNKNAWNKKKRSES
jgi:hypothetical protein